MAFPLNRVEVYTEETHTTNWTGAWASPQAGNVQITQFGSSAHQLVHLRIPVVFTTASGGQASIGTLLPAQYRPNSNYQESIIVTNNGSDTFGAVIVDTGGDIIIGVGASHIAFSASGSCGWLHELNLTYATT